DPPRRNGEGVGELDGVERVVDVLRPHRFVRGDKALVGTKAAEVEAVNGRLLLEALKIAGLFALHLDMEDLNAIEPHPRRLIDALLDRQFRIVLEPTERIGRYRDTVADLRRSGLLSSNGRAKRQPSASRGDTSKSSTTD